MPRGDKSAYSNKQKRQAEHIEEGYEKRGTPAREAKRRAWATVNKTSHGGEKPGGGAAASRPASARSAAARKAARTRARRGS